MKLSILNYIKNASDETLMEMAKLTQAEQREQEAQKEEVEQKYYTFSGTWSWGCWATSEEDARRQFDFDASTEDINIDYEHTQIEVDDF